MTMMTSSYFFLKKEKTSQNFRYMQRTHITATKRYYYQIRRNGMKQKTIYIYIFIYNMIDRETYYRDVNLFKKLVAIDKVKKIYRFIIFWRKKN